MPVGAESAGASFPVEVVEAIKAHMNRDHQADSLLICRVLGGRPTAARAWVTSVDGGGIDFGVDVDGREASARVSWSRAVVERSGVRSELVRMVDDARQAAGLPSSVEDRHS